MTNRHEQRIAVCMATYNGMPHVVEQLDSICSQLSDSDALIIVDDASTDETVMILKSRYGNQITLLENEANLGHVKSFERAIRSIEADWYVLADQDDLWLPGRLDAVRRHPLYQTSRPCLITIDEVLSDSLLAPLLGARRAARPRRSRLINLLSVVSIGRVVALGCTMAFNRSLAELALPIPRKVAAHDQWIFALANAVGIHRHVARPLVLWRRHSAVQTRQRPGRLWKHFADKAALDIELARRTRSCVRWAASNELTLVTRALQSDA